jgi:TRAP-type C4-dicarboxylate transport system permease small subunit
MRREGEMMTTLDKIDNLLGRILLVLSGAAVLALMLLATGNVVLRIFQAPFRGTYEIVSFLGAIGVAFALASTQRGKGHIVVDILSSRYPRRVRRLVDALSAAIGALFFGIVSRQVWVWGARIMASGELSETLKVVYYPFVFGVAAGFGLLTLTCLLDIPRAFRKDGEAAP